MGMALREGLTMCVRYPDTHDAAGRVRQALCACGGHGGRASGRQTPRGGRVGVERARAWKRIAPHTKIWQKDIL